MSGAVREDLNNLEQVDSNLKLSLPEIAKYLNNKFNVKMSVYASQLLQHFVRLNQFILILQIMNQHIHFIHSGDKNIID